MCLYFRVFSVCRNCIMKILMTEQNAYVEMDASLPLLILKSCVSVMHNIPYEAGTYRRKEKCVLDWENGKKNCSHFLCTDFQHPVRKFKRIIHCFQRPSHFVIKSCPDFLYNTDNHNHKFYVTNYIKPLLHICMQNSVTCDSKVFHVLYRILAA